MTPQEKVRHHCWTLMRSGPENVGYLYVTSMASQWRDVQLWFQNEGGHIDIERKGDTLVYVPRGVVLRLISVTMPTAIVDKIKGTVVYGIFYDIVPDYMPTVSSKLWIYLANHCHVGYHHNIIGLSLKDLA